MTGDIKGLTVPPSYEITSNPLDFLLISEEAEKGGLRPKDIFFPHTATVSSGNLRHIKSVQILADIFVYSMHLACLRVCLLGKDGKGWSFPQHISYHRVLCLATTKTDDLNKVSKRSLSEFLQLSHQIANLF